MADEKDGRKRTKSKSGRLCGVAGPRNLCHERRCSKPAGHPGEHEGQGCFDCPDYVSWPANEVGGGR